MGNRLTDGAICVSCGNVTLELNPVWAMCSTCRKEIEAKAAELMKHKKARKGHPDRITVQTNYKYGSLQKKIKI